MPSAADRAPALNVRSAWLIALGGIAGGAFDIVYAFVFYGALGVPPIRILQSIASGLLGRQAYAGGAATAALGLFLHLAILVVAAFVFYAASRRAPVLAARWFVSGLVFGVAIYVVMNFVVVPLSAFPQKQAYPLPAVITGLLVHAVLVGGSIAYGVRSAWAAPQRGLTPAGT
jgi:hypothetical protein